MSALFASAPHHRNVAGFVVGLLLLTWLLAGGLAPMTYAQTEERGEPFRLVRTAPESGKYNLDVSSGDELCRGTGS